MSFLYSLASELTVIRRSVIEDYRLAKEITMVSGEVNNVVIAHAQFLEELDSLETRHVPVKMDEFSMRFKGRTVR
ncbi:hypothetical protein Tco_0683264 [Tanacetum coccineum]|uniref:Uncharacterized protein n=1 Tax=Tanacetum coccineum TaxID=301880 RepID=A0ABQ4XTQ2_9ASTR